MIISSVLTAVTNDPLYIDFVPIFIESWLKLYPEIEVKIILVNEFIPKDLFKFKNNIILFKPLPNISNKYISQIIRILYPSLIKNISGGILITDIDMIPMNSSYFSDNIKNYVSDKFICYGKNKKNVKNNELPICYNIATSNTWLEIFNINNLNELKIELIKIYSTINYENLHGGNGWATDQEILYKRIINWKYFKNRFIILNDNITGYNRLCRDTFDIPKNKPVNITGELKKSIESGLFSDYHMKRPFNDYKYFNNSILSLLKN